MRKRSRNSRRDGSEAAVKISRIRKDLEDEFPGGFAKSSWSRRAYRARVTAEDSNAAVENFETNTIGAESSEKEMVLSSSCRASGRGRGSIGNRGTTRAAFRTRRRTVDTTKASAIGAETPEKQMVLPSSRRNYQRGRGSSCKRGTTRAAARTPRRTSDTAMADAIGDMSTEKDMVPSSSRLTSGRARGSINNRGASRTVPTTSRHTAGTTVANVIGTDNAEKEMAPSSSRAAHRRGRGSASNRGTTRAAPRTSKRMVDTTMADVIGANSSGKGMLPESSMKKSSCRGGRRLGRPRVSDQLLVNNDDEELASSPRRIAVSAIEKSTQGKKGRTPRKAAELSRASFVEKGDTPEKELIRGKTTRKAAKPSRTYSVGSGDTLEKKPISGRKIRKAAVPKRRSSVEGGDTLEEELCRSRKTWKAAKSGGTSSVGNEDSLENGHFRGKKIRKGAEPGRKSSLEGGDTLERELIRGTKAKSADEEVKKISRSKAIIEDQKWRKMDSSSMQDVRGNLPPRGKRKCEQRRNVKSTRARQGARREQEEVVKNEDSTVKDNIDSTTIDITVLRNCDDMSPIVDSSVFWRIFVRGQVFLGRWMILDETPSFRRGVVAYLVVENSEAAYEGLLLAQLADSPLGRLPEEVYFVQLQSERNRSAMFQTVVDARFVEKTSDSPKFFYAVMLLR
ncbi:hypothetical protein Q1695_009145 [Nippostrongylus brasiliensis]|nr:hypothetical protein Q1695_009145 [Nippostrongylus brasiliensis]